MRPRDNFSQISSDRGYSLQTFWLGCEKQNGRTCFPAKILLDMAVQFQCFKNEDIATWWAGRPVYDAVS